MGVPEPALDIRRMHLPLMGPTFGPPVLAVAVLRGLLVALALVQFAASVGAVFQPMELMYGEAILYDHTTRIVRGEPLYQALDRPPYTVAAYTPLYYWLAAGLQAVAGPGFWPGRGLSFIVSLVAAGLVAYLAAHRTGDRLAGAFAGLLFSALGLPWAVGWSLPWAGLYKEDVLGTALSLGAIAILTGGTSRRRLVVGGVLAGLAVLTKQTLIAAGIAGALWLWHRDRREAALFAGAGMTTALVPCLGLEATTRALLSNIVLANIIPFRWDALVLNLHNLASFQLGPLAVVLVYLLGPTRAAGPARGDLVVLFWAASLLPLVGLAKVGSNVNYWLELAAATAVLATHGIWSRLAHSPRRETFAAVPVLMLAMTPMLWLNLVPIAVSITRTPHLGSGAFWPHPNGAMGLESVIERVRSEPREVLAEPLDVLALAGRPILLEPYIFSILEREGRWDPTPLIRRICAGEVGLVVLGYPLEQSRSRSYHGYEFWPASVVAALRARMLLESEQAGRFLYVLRQTRAGAGGNSCGPLRQGDPPPWP